MTALVLMRADEGWSVFCDGSPVTVPVSRGVALELTIRLARDTASAGGAVSLVIDEDPDGAADFDFQIQPEPPMYFRQREARSFSKSDNAGRSLSWTAQIPSRA